MNVHSITLNAVPNIEACIQGFSKLERPQKEITSERTSPQNISSGIRTRQRLDIRATVLSTPQNQVQQHTSKLATE
jgi:hypothetical protein